MVTGFIKSIDLRFEDATVEDEFRAEAEIDLVKSARLGGSAFACIGVCLVASLVRTEVKNDKNPFAWKLTDPRTFVFCGWLAMSLVNALVALASHWSLRGGPRCMRSETEVVAVCAAGASFLMLFSFRLCPVIMGLDPADVWAVPPNPGGGAGWYNVILCVIGPAVLAPIRTHVGAFHPIFTATIFSISSYIMDSKLHGVTAMNFLIPLSLYTFAGFAIVNSWNREAHRRGKFMAVRTQEQLQFAKEAATSLLRMTCESAIWVSTNGLTVLESDRWLDHIMEKPMTGRSLTDCLPPDSTIPSELRRLIRKKTGEAANVPVSLLPVRLLTGRGVTVSAEMFVVDPLLGRMSSSTVCSALTDAMGTMLGIRCRTEASVGLTEMTRHEGSDSLDSSPGHVSGPSLLAEGREPSEAPPSCSVSQRAPAPSCIGSVLAMPEDAIWLPRSAAVLLHVAPNRTKVERAISLKEGDAIYCLCGTLSESVLVPVPIAVAETSEQEIAFRRAVLSYQGHKEHDLLATAGSGVLVQKSTRRLQWIAASELAPSPLYEVVAADRDTVTAGFSAIRYQARLHQGEQFTSAVALALRHRVLGVLARTVPDDTALNHDEPFFVIAAARSFSDNESAVTSDFLSTTLSQPSSRATRVTLSGTGRHILL
eukprot:TRINITY_DN6346_c0_g2_i1.p1 TRINITY_DN6346_c0_g2~~TRINITY_DN6346_c0_g2_i1.p1  ORF type:complete len:652 (+),score=72.10 TRINITY_DN6346_c0_g2_i1:113-2068(+)